MIIRVFVIMATLSLVFTTSPAYADKSADTIKACLQANWNDVIHKGAPLGSAFDIHSLTARIVGAPYRGYTPNMRAAARNAVRYAMKEALEDNLGTLRRVKLGINKINHLKRTIRATVSFKHPIMGTHSGVVNVPKNGGCKIMYMVVAGVTIDNWIKDTNHFKKFTLEQQKQS